MWQIILGAFFVLFGIGLLALGVFLYGESENPVNFITMLGGFVTAYQGGRILGFGIADRY